jgi:hypothetical protein
MSSLKLMFFLPLAALSLTAGAAQDATPAAQGQGMVVVRDAQTGQLRTPTAAEIRALQPAASASMTAQSQPAMVTGPGGRRSVRLGERHMVYSVVKRDGEGKLGEQCVHGVHAAERATSGAAEPAAKHEEHRHESR